MTTYPLATLAATVDSTGIAAPPYADIFASLQASMRSIYGSDIYIDADSQDGQLLAVFAQAVSDANDTLIAVYNSFSPAKAQGAALASNVKINGLLKGAATNSTADLTCSGDVGQEIINGQAQDTLGGTWNLPPSVIIGAGGFVIVTATAAEPGAQAAPAGSITRILTPTRGWTSVTNVAAATPGDPVESDAALRQRQAVSTARPALSVFDSMQAEIANLPGILRYKGYENATNATDANGVPAYATSFVVEGGDATAIAGAIAIKKTPGSPTYGTTSVVVVDPQGVNNTINFFRPTVKRITAHVNVSALSGYVSTTGDAIKAAVAAYVSGLDIGGDVYNSKTVAVANLIGTPVANSFNITSITMAIFPAAESTADIVIAFNAAANLALADITMVVT